VLGRRGDISVATTVFAGATIAVLVLLGRFAPKVPGPLVAFGGGILLVSVGNLADHGVALIPKVPGGLPIPEIPTLDHAGSLLPGAIAIALMAFLETIAVARTMRRPDDPAIDGDQEMVAIGAASLAGAFFRSLPAAGGLLPDRRQRPGRSPEPGQRADHEPARRAHRAVPCAGAQRPPAGHARRQVPYGELVFRPMRELADVLRTAGFSVAATTSGGSDFFGAVSERLFQIPPELVVGSAAALRYAQDGTVRRCASLAPSSGQESSKALELVSRLGRRPTVAVGNADDDIEMFQTASVAVLLHHDDADREYAYDTGAEQALAVARARGWIVVSVKRDWSSVF
jgi:phosphoserine phosphatase